MSRAQCIKCGALGLKLSLYDVWLDDMVWDELEVNVGDAGVARGGSGAKGGGLPDSR